MRRSLCFEVKAALLSGVLGLALGCGPSPSTPTDAGADAGVQGVVDAGPADAGVNPVDAGPADAGPPDAGPQVTPDAGPPDAGTVQGPRCGATTVLCQDEQVAQLKLYDVANPALITEEGTAPNFATLIDSSAGGTGVTKAYVYARFTDTGLQKVNISDEEAFVSLDWDIAFRRYVIRLNSGVGGPSCVEGARVAPGATFDGLTEIPANIPWRTEAYFTNSCDFVPDTSGIGAPATITSSFWSYQSCVAMTGNIFVAHLRDGRYVKLTITGYYATAAQQTCNQTGSVPTPSGSGNLRMKWSFINGPANP